MSLLKHPARITVSYIAITALSVLATWLLHEAAHWAAGEGLGNTMALTLNTAYPTAGNYTQPWHAMVVSAAGPALTLLQAVVVFVVIKKSSNYYWFPALLACLYMRVLAGVLNLINLNDEGRISKDLGIGTYTLSMLVCAALFYLTYCTVKREGYRKGLAIGTLLLVIVFSSIIVLADQAWKLKLLG